MREEYIYRTDRQIDGHEKKTEEKVEHKRERYREEERERGEAGL